MAWPLIVLVWIGCTGRHIALDAGRQQVDSLNERAYDWHYRDVDSVRNWATQALDEALRLNYHEGQAEALNNLAFERFQQMDFDSVLVIAQQIADLTSSPYERLVADVMQMKVAQRTSDNLAFFQHRTHALQYIRKLSRHEESMDVHEHRRFAYGCSETHIVASTYFYYLDQQERAIAEIQAAEPYCQMPEDTAQWLNYCYMRGSGGLSEQTEDAAVAMEEFGYLTKCFWLARYEGFHFFEANAEQSLAMLFSDSTRLATVQSRQPEQVTLLTTIFGQENTAQRMAESAFEHFVLYDDLYQEACVMRTLGELAFESGEYEEAVQCYAKALACVNLHHLCYYAPENLLQPGNNADLLQIYVPNVATESVERKWMQSPQVKTVPEWIAGIRQQLSVVFSALDMKAESDYNRNIYLDLLDVTREDAELESRAAELKEESTRLRRMVVLVLVLAIMIGVLTWLLIRTNRHRNEAQERLLRQRLQQVQEVAQQQQEALVEEQEELREQQCATEQRLLRDKRQNIEKRAKLQLVYAIVPFLDRIIHEVNRMEKRGETSENSLAYIGELTDRITEYNDLLTEWIQMEQGQLSLQLSSFSLEPLFKSLRKSHYAYDQKGLTLNVEASDLIVKADRALTLFMINTLADNARKFTPAGGSVTISAHSGENEDGRFVEIAVQDTGCGMMEADIDLVLNNKIYDASAISCPTNGTRHFHQWNTAVPPMEHADTYICESQNNQKGFGFGLMNCKGIIEKYRKTNPLFRVCRLGIDSRVGDGSRFWFRLPRVMTMIVALLFGSMNLMQAQHIPTMMYEVASRQPQAAYALADSVYFCNIDSRYADALKFAEQALETINESRVHHSRESMTLLTLRDNGQKPAELRWWHSQEKVDYSLLLGIRNETAIAALALHDWALYRYNNHVYSQLYKLANQDTTLEAYCQKTEQSQQRQRWALWLIVALLLSGVAAVYFLYVRPRIRFRRKLAKLGDQRIEELQQMNIEKHERRQSDFEMAEDEHRRRLYEEERLHVQNQIIDNCLSAIKHETMYYPGRIQQLVRRGGELSTLSETVAYYKEVYSLLSAQAAQQSEAVNFHRRNVKADELILPLPHRCQQIATQMELNVSLTTDNRLENNSFRGDPDLLTMLLEALLEAELTMTAAKGKITEEKPMEMTLQVLDDNRFTRFTLMNPVVQLSDEQLHDFFMPHRGGIPWLICKQIIREHDTFLGHPGCRINAEAAEQGHVVWFTLPQTDINAKY